jgi:hypothetical protein
MSETASNTSSNIAYNNSFTSGPVRTGIFATGSTSRATSGSGYYGNMELSGNLWERVVTVGNATGRTFSGVHGNGTLTSGGASDVSGWPAAAGTGWKGGAYDAAAIVATASDRNQAANENNSRAANAGGRGVRTISSGIVTDGLVLWLDAGIAPSYAGSGTTWTDISGNRNNGTLTNGPTYNSSNGGSIVFDGNNDFIETTYTPGNISSQTMSCWINKINLQYSFILAKNNLYYGFEIYPTTIYINITNDQFASVSYNTNGWQNIVFTYDGNQTGNSNRLKIYFNGNIQTATFTGVIPSSVNVTDVIQIGRRWWAIAFSQGSIAQLSIYNRALTAAEVLQNFNAQKARFGL